MERRLAAIFAADVAGYARLIRADEEGTLREFEGISADLIGPTIAAHNGRIVKFIGDGVLAEFASVVDAVRAAMELQRAICERNAAIEREKRLDFRIGINLGDIVIDDADIHGDGVNIAARLEGLAEPGGICVSANVHDEVLNRIDVTFQDLGEKKVKNIDHPLRVWGWTADNAGTENSDRSDSSLDFADKPAIAVLPFDNMSDDPAQAFFADGMTEDLITALSKFHSLIVIARNSSFAFKDRTSNVAQIARELGARYILEGSVRSAGDRLRITAQLVDGEQGSHIWAERYDRSLDDIFDVQDEITETIVGTITPEVSTVERKKAARKQPESLNAWGLLQRGLNFMWQWDQEGFLRSVEMFRMALDRDPTLSQAHTYLSFTLLYLHYLGHTKAGSHYFAEAAGHARQALKQDDTDSLAHCVLARILSHEHRHADSIDEARRAVQLNPNDAFAHQSLAIVLVWANRSAEGLTAIEQALRLSPNDPFMHIMLATKGLILGYTGRLREAFEVMRNACRIPHNDYRPWLFLAAYAAEMDLPDQAGKAAAKVLELRPGFTAALFRDIRHQMDPALHDSLARWCSPSALMGQIEVIG